MSPKIRSLIALFVALVWNIAPALATDTSTWKQPDLFVKRNLYVNRHILNGKPADGEANAYYAAPTIAAGTGAGSSPTIAITGSDTAGKITLTTGSSPATSAVVATVTFGSAFPTNSFVLLEPATVNTTTGGGILVYVGSTGTTSFTLNSGGTALTASTAYGWYYHVLGN